MYTLVPWVETLLISLSLIMSRPPFILLQAKYTSFGSTGQVIFLSQSRRLLASTIRALSIDIHCHISDGSAAQQNSYTVSKNNIIFPPGG